jgi:predicted RNA-binding Zn ribbon-like protein
LVASTAESSLGRAGDREGEALAIRFINTSAWRLRAPPEERLSDPDALLIWLGENGMGRPRDLKRLGTAWRKEPAKGEAAYQFAIELREAIYRLLLARIERTAPPGPTLNLINDILARSTPGTRLDWRQGQPVWNLRDATTGLDLLKPIALSALELMTGPQGERVKQCQDDRGCGWLFVDQSRAQNRRWCSMGDCGNRAKAHRHYQRQQRKG